MTEPTEPVLARDPTTGRFRPGHTGLGGRPGRTREERRKLRSLAIVLREQWPAEQIAHWLREVAAGRDPDRPGATAAIEWPIRMRAAKMYLERALGQPAQSIAIDAEISRVDEPALPGPEAFEALDAPARLALREGLRLLLQQRAPAEPEPATSATAPRGSWNRHRHARARLGSDGSAS